MINLVVSGMDKLLGIGWWITASSTRPSTSCQGIRTRPADSIAQTLNVCEVIRLQLRSPFSAIQILERNVGPFTYSH